jgi:hypothetical protein
VVVSDPLNAEQKRKIEQNRQEALKKLAASAGNQATHL